MINTIGILDLAGLPYDANDPNVPSFYRNMMKDRFRNMGSSIDLTSE